MFAAQERAELTRELSRLYPDTDSIRRIARTVDVQTEQIDMDGAALNVWSAVVYEAYLRGHGYLGRLVQVPITEGRASDEIYRLYTLWQSNEVFLSRIQPGTPQ